MDKDEKSLIDIVTPYRNQALCIKTNIQVLKEIWSLQPYFKEKKTGAFYGVVQEDCIFRIVMETYKLLIDSRGGSVTIYNMANECYKKMIESQKFDNYREELLQTKKKFTADLDKYMHVKETVKKLRNNVFAHNGCEYYWFADAYIECWSMTDEIYDGILDISNICIEYCNYILGYYNIRRVYEYSNCDDVRRLFGLKTMHDKIRHNKHYFENL